jgi:hypothetical protein
LTHEQVREVLDNPDFFSGSAKALEHYRAAKTDAALEYLTRSILRAYEIDTNTWKRSVGVVRSSAEDAVENEKE